VLSRQAYEFDKTPSSCTNYQVAASLGDFHLATARYELAAEYYQAACRLEPSEPAPHVGLGNIALQSGRMNEAERCFCIAAKLEPRCQEAVGALAMLYQQDRRYSEAFDAYLKCLELDPDNLLALLGLFQTSCQMGTFGKITGYLELYLKNHPEDTSVMFCLATLYARDARYTDARRCAESILALDPGKVEAAELLQQVLRKLRDKNSQQLSAMA
jgi:cytochrome c-type biogenesis protein CcmH/NrfG